MAEILPDDAPAPRLCHLIKWPDFDGYGFNLHAERSNPGQFIGKIDEQSPAQLAGLREGDRIVEVNGVNISNENHRQVVERIKANAQEAKLLVVDPEADAWYREQDLVVKSSQINVVYIRTPVPRPEPDSPRATNFHAGQQQQQRARQPQANGAPQSSDEKQQQQQQPQDQQQQQEKQQEKPTDSASDPKGQQNSPTPNQSLETSDFNEESLEQQDRREDSARASRVSPPMSPDSGKGDEEHQPPALAKPGGETLTVEAEINHRRPPPAQQQPQPHEERAPDDQDGRQAAAGTAGAEAPRGKTDTEIVLDEKRRNS